MNCCNIFFKVKSEGKRPNFLFGNVNFEDAIVNAKRKFGRLLLTLGFHLKKVLQFILYFIKHVDNNYSDYFLKSKITFFLHYIFFADEIRG